MSLLRRLPASILTGLLLIALPLSSAAELQSAREFSTVEIYLDTDAVALAAYQLSLVTAGPTTRLVGVEGGATPAFAEPPHYDPRALRGGQIVLAAMQLEAPLPSHRVHVATLHVEHASSTPPRITALEIVAVSEAGEEITAQFSFEIGETP